MAIYAENNGITKVPMEAGSYAARCFSMIEIGTVNEVIEGKEKTLQKVRLGFEFPTETRVFKEENGPQPYTISKEFTLSMHEKASLRKFLEAWRGRKFDESEAKKFDITVLIGKECLLSIIHKESKGKTFEEISSVSLLPKGMVCPPAVNKTCILSYDNFDKAIFDAQPDFIKDKIKSSSEYKALQQPTEVGNSASQEDHRDLPF